MSDTGFDIRRDTLVRHRALLFLIGGLVLVGWILLRLGVRKALEDWARSLCYRLDGDCLAMSSSFVLRGVVLYRQESRIPLARITDLKLVQGPILSRMGLWTMYVQTAGSGFQCPEGALHGLEDPHGARDAILRAISAARSG